MKTIVMIRGSPLKIKNDTTFFIFKNNYMINENNRGYKTLKSLLEMKIESIPFLWDRILPQKGVSIITGPSDSNKSTFLRQLAYAVIKKETSFLGQQLNVRHGKVIIVCSEDSDLAIAAMVNKQKNIQFTDAEKGSLLFCFKAANNLDELEKIIEKHPIDFLGLDTWTDSFTGDLNSTVSVRENLGKLHELSNRYGFAVIGIHHTKKNAEALNPSKGQILGSQGIEAFARSIIDIRRIDTISHKRAITIVKGNYTPDAVKGKPIIVELNPETMLLEYREEAGGYGFQNLRLFDPTDKGQVLIPFIKEMLQKNLSQDRIVEVLKQKFPDKKTPSKGTVNQWIREMSSQSGTSFEKEMTDL